MSQTKNAPKETLKERMSRIGKLGTGKAKTRSKAQYSQMGKARWEQYWREKDALQEARANGFTD